MTKHKPGETKEEREFRKIAEHNRRVLKEYYYPHDADKAIKGNIHDLSGRFREITATFSEEEKDEAAKIGLGIKKCLEPEDGFRYEEIAMVLCPAQDKERYKTADRFDINLLQKEYRDTYRSKIDRLLYVLQYMAFEYVFSAPLEKKEEGGKMLMMVPCVRMTDRRKGADGKITIYDEPVEVIFNGYKKKYAAEQFKKLGIVGKIEPPKKFNPEHVQIELIISHFKGDYNNKERLDKLLELASSILNMLTEPTKDNKEISESELIHEFIPESIGKIGKELEPYTTMFNDAMYMVYTTVEDSELTDAISEWKTAHGYNDGR